MNIVFMALITVGGVGFSVWEDIRKYQLRWIRYSLHTKIVLCVSAFLTFGGAILFCIFEREGFRDLSFGQAFLRSMFQSVTCRTAGFNTIDLSSISTPSVLLSCVLMFIGGSAGSTAGGIKTTTIASVFIFLFAGLRAQRAPQLFGRTMKDDTVRKASGVICFNCTLIILASLVLTTVQKLSLGDVLFETFSAMGTVGMTTGITRALVPVSQLAIMTLMFSGRVGSVTLASAFLEKRAAPRVNYPSEDVNIG